MKKQKLKIYFYVAENSGVGYYRQYLPAWVLRESGVAETRINDFRWGKGDHVEPTEKAFFEICNWADLIVVGRMDKPEYYAKWGGAKEFFNMPIILDTDDNVQHVRPSNPGYQGYHPGSEHLIWNKQAMEKIFDAISVTTDHLKEFYNRYHPRIYVLPNNLDIPKWEKSPLRKIKKNDKLRLGFICSGSHAEGFGIIQKSVYNILKKYKNVEFYHPEMYYRLFDGAPKEVKKQIKKLPWIYLKKWPKELRKLGLDIALMPLKDNNFNRGKSNLRYIESSMTGAASIASPVEPYRTINDGVDGILASEENEWFKAIESLILNPDERERLASNAQKRVVKEFNIWDNIGIWNNVYQEIHKKFHDFYGSKKRYMDIGKGQYQEITTGKGD